ncbi:MAG: hypothetical protein A2283_18400 [Lentisphaerae bacterium RIFOXYA12_FULL_48_11]|nr:MAG: hypothetical protein A2283_18400 [Lentisphaerae bacterium RIFOXYA12_FULL_48_11]
MERDYINKIGIDEQGRIYITPATKTFPYIYLEAAEIHWDPDLSRLHSPTPREWTHFDWFCHIVGIAAEQSCELILSTNTEWSNVPDELRTKIENWMKTRLA